MNKSAIYSMLRRRCDEFAENLAKEATEFIENMKNTFLISVTFVIAVAKCLSDLIAGFVQ